MHTSQWGIKFNERTYVKCLAHNRSSVKGNFFLTQFICQMLNTFMIKVFFFFN